MAKFEPERKGGGWAFQKNLSKIIPQSSYEEAAIYLIAGASMLERSDVDKAKRDGKKIVVRLDNAPRNSRNRNSGMSRLKYCTDNADLVVYQSKWARDFLYPFTGKDGPVILNGVDTSIYNSNSRIDDTDTYLYARSSRDEGKQWILAWYWFVNKKGILEIAGYFSPDNLTYNFDFYNGEKYRFVGVQPSLVDSYKRNRYFLYTYLNDACSNTLLEARACGCEIIDVYGMLQTGGAPEIMQLEDLSAERMAKEYIDVIGNL